VRPDPNDDPAAGSERAEDPAVRRGDTDAPTARRSDTDARSAHRTDAAASNERRAEMIRLHLEGRGIHDERVLDAFRRVPREAFVPPHLADMAYADEALPIGLGQTISQPFLVAEMLAALELSGDERVLEIGTGSGYAAALLGLLAREVDTVERISELARNAAALLEELGFSPERVRVHQGDGTLGWPPNAPFEAIVVAAGGPRVPPSLIDQLAPLGRLIVPIGDARTAQRLVRITKLESGELATDDLGSVRFVPLVGDQGWDVQGSSDGPVGG
jgi:protein-L-isoaspartate(D-aspartate) O-methyltransferase